ncbi:DUF6701 domain-containing protein [Methylobacter sp.]|uniref:DUF6701 domain-containing protein n=1 Tax=Methylobacter sp. TaxID=2051955 RepID=UPI002FE3D209
MTEQVDSNTNSGNGGGFGVATGVKTTAGTYNSTTGALVASSVQGRISIALKPKTTTLGDGTNPANATLAPGAAITDLDAFTLQTSSGTDSLTALTVTLTGTNSFQALSEVRITSNDGATTYFSAVTNPTSNTISFSGSTPLPVTSTATTFKVRITPKTHTNMPVPPGFSYSVGGTVTAFTNTNEQLGSDGASAAVTVDNLSPASATATSGSAGLAKNTLNWTSSAATDFNTTSGSIVYRWAAASAGSEVPAEGSTPTLGGSNGTATVACVVSSAASTALVRIDGTGGSSDCTTTALTDGQAYTYKVFQKDTNGNYDVGVTIGTFTPSSITLGDGTNPANATLAPGAAITDLDAFTLQTSSGTDSVTALTVTLTGTNSFQALSEVRITSNNGATTYFAAAADPTSNTISFSGGTPIPATTTATTFKVRITPKTHANMPVPPGLAYSVGGAVAAFTSTKVQTGSDGASASLTVDNLSPASATATSGSAGLAKNTLNWTSSAATDFNTTSGSIVYRWAAASAGSEVPAEGSTPTLGGSNGTATVACVVSSAASTALVRIDGTGGSSDCTTTALTNGQAYTYKVFQKDSNGNYDVGVTVGTFTPTSITLGDGTNPVNTTLAPSAGITDLDAFTLQTSNGTDSVTALNVTLTGTNSFQALSEVRITSSDGVTTYFSAVVDPTSNTISFSGGTPIPATTTATTFKVRITPKTHANMPVPPGLSYSVGGTVSGFTSTKLQAGSDGASASLTVDNLSPASATAVSGSSDDAKVALNWTTSVATDFNTTSGSIIYRWAAASAGSEVPVEGSTPTLGSSNGTATVACVVSTAASTALARIDGTGGSSDCTTTALTNGQVYSYKVFQKDANGNYDTGVIIGTITPAIVNCTSLATGNWAATSTWTQCRSGVPLAGDTVTIASGHTVTLNTTTPAISSLTINSGGTLTASAANTLTLGGNLTNNGTLSFGTFGSVTLTTASQWTGTGATWTLNNLTLGSQALSFNATDTFTLGINGIISGLGTINSGATNTGITLDFRSASTQTVPTTGVTYPNLTVSGGSTKTPASGTLDIRGNFTVVASTTFAGNTNNPAVALKGNFSNSGTFNAGSGVWTLSGTSAQSIVGTPSFGSLTTNNASGVSLSSNVTVSTVLALTNGTVTTGANTLIASGGDCTTSISRTNGYVIGNLQLTIPATNPVTCSYPVGDSIGYAPISINKTGTNTGTLTGRTDSGDHPDGSATVGINQAKNANHYWTLTAGTLLPTTPYSAIFQFCATGTCVVPTELDIGANTSNFVVAKKSVSWSNQTVGTKNATSTQATGLTGFGVFEVGEQGSLNCTSLATGNWNTAATWTNCHGGVPLTGDTVTIISSHTVTLNTTAPATGSLSSLTINTGGTLTASAANTLTLGGNLTNNGTLSLGTSGSVALTAASQWTGSGATWTVNNLALGSQALSFNATDTFTFGINGSISGLGTINSGATNTDITLDFRNVSTQTMPTTGVTYPNLMVSGGGTKTPASGTLDIRGNFTVAASTTFAGNTFNPAVTLQGNFSNSGTFNAGSGVWTLSGTNAQSIAGTPSFGSLVINNASGVSLSSNVTSSTSLTLTSGTITTGANTLIYSNANCSTSPVILTSGYVIGNLQLTVPATNPVTCSYPVGDSIGYAPISITKSGTNTGTLTGRADSGDHPNTATSASGIDATKSANHYWTLTAGSLSTTTPYTATFQFCSNASSCTVTEVDSGATTSSFIVALKSSGIWTSQTPGIRNAYSTQAIGMTSFGEFAVGELSTNNCYNDGFTGSNGASPGTNWSVGYKTGTFGNPIIFGNRLRLTDASGTVATWATLQRLFPAAGNKVTIEFEHFSYDGTGADGITVVLSDASVAPVAGAFGGSLGYAQKGQNPISDCNTAGGCPGFAGGWLGVALDEFGNYSTNIEGRFGGGATITPNSVAVRGSGSGMSGYRFLQGTGSLSPAIEDNNTANPPHRYRIIVDHTDSDHAWASVERDTTGGGTAYTTLIGCPPGVTSGCTAFDVKDPGNSQNAVPAYWNLSFTGSTGGSANIHEIDTLKVCTVQGLASPVLHHIKIEHGGTACTSNAATVTVKACADAACAALYMGSVTVNLSTTGGTWLPTSPITFSGGQTTVTLTDTTSRSDTLGATATSPTAANATQCYNGITQTCSLTFAACTFDVVEVGAAVNTSIYTKLANTTFNLDVVSRSGSSQSLTAIELVDVSSGTCSSPAAVLSPVTLSPALTTSGVPNFTANQHKTFSFTYNNAVPNVRVRVTTAGPLYSCSSDNFAIRPQTFNLTSNATQAGSSGAPVFRAGADPFTLSATAVYSATTTNNYTGTPKLNLTSGMITTALPHLGSLGSTTFSAAVSGIATASNLTYSEVGSFSLAQYAVYDDTFANVDSVKGECSSGFSNTLANSRFSCQFGSDAAGAFGRFVPDHFRVSGTIANACSTGTFTYMGQPFSLSTSKVVAAENAANSVTQNYTGSYANGTVSFGAENLDNGTDISSRLTFASGSWVSGIYTLTNANGTFTRPTSTSSDATWGPFESLDIGLTVNDSDVTTSPKVNGADMNPSAAGGSSFTYKKFSGGLLRMRLGRLSLQNTYGSELLPLPIPVEAQYWQGNYYMVNTNDSCTTFPASSVIMANYLQNLSACETNFSPAGNLAMSGGVLNPSLNLTASGAGNTGSVDLTLNIGSSASGNTCTTPVQAAATAANMTWFGTNPTARATFGIYEGNSRFIYIRELY